ASGADDPERHQPAPLRDAQGDHGREEKGDPQGGGAGRVGVAAEDRRAVSARERQEDAADWRGAGRSGQGAGAQAAGRGEGPVILVIAEQRDGTLNRATWETVAAAQQMTSLGAAGEVVVLVPGASVGRAAAELAAAQVKEVVTVEHAALDPYTPDGFT